MDEFNLVDAPKELNKAPETEFYIATVSSVSSSGVKLLFAGESTAANKYYKRLGSANVSSGDRVVVMKQSGTYIVLGSIGGNGGSGTYITSNISEIATAASGITITEAWYAQSGNVATLYLVFRPTTAISSQGFNVATMKSGKRPAVYAPAQYWSGKGAYINSSGVIFVDGTATSTTTNYFVFATYVIA